MYRAVYSPGGEMLRNPTKAREERLLRKVAVQLTPSESYSQPQSTGSGMSGVNDSVTGVWKPYGRYGISTYPFVASGRMRY